jgi:hypothetical protein
MNSNQSFSKCLTAFRLIYVPWASAVLCLVSFTSAAAALPGKTFPTPEAAVSALSTAVMARDTNALAAIFGPAFADIKSADTVQNQNELTKFGENLSASNHISRAADDRCILETGVDRFPFAIPIVRKDGAWFFDTDAGKEELINRRVGRNELEALQSLRTAAQAQREYAAKDHDNDEVLEFAQKIISTPGKKDGLYWSPDIDGEISPLGPAFADAQEEGYFKQPGKPNVPQPFHGYFFKILTRQGQHAPGGTYDYIINGNMIGGFAFVAWPAKYGDSGVMTFIINQRGKIYQKDLGPNTEATATNMKVYDPDTSWTVVTD